MMTFHIFLQARQNSTRFPNKILKQICGKSVFELILERLENIKNSKIFLVTGSYNKNKQLIEKSIECGIEYFSGNENNVLDRFYKASKQFSSKKIIRITGDCPLLDYQLINNAEETFDGKKIDLLCNYMPRTFPHGYDFEIFSSICLEISQNDVLKNFSSSKDFETTSISPLEYITQSNKFSIQNIENISDQSFIRLTLDYPEDFEVIKQIYENLYIQDPQFDSEKIMNFINKNPNLLKFNKKYVKFSKSELDNFLDSNHS